MGEEEREDKVNYIVLLVKMGKLGCFRPSASSSKRKGSDDRKQSTHGIHRFYIEQCFLFA